MKKLKVILSLVLSIMMLLSITACGKGNGANPDCKDGHLFVYYYYNEDAGCEKNGTETATCKCANCNATHTREREGTMLPHRYVIVTYKAHTCTQDGVLTHYLCSRCLNLFDQEKNLIEDKNEVIIPASHFPNEAKWEWTAEGHYHPCTKCNEVNDLTPHQAPEGAQATIFSGVYCVDCGYEITPALPHTHQLKFVTETNSTCTEQGVKAHYICTVCNSTFLDATSSSKVYMKDLLKPFGHEWESEYTVIEEASPGKQGTKAKMCKHGCGEYTDLTPYLYEDKDYTDNV